jgi:imidazolonepropionase-like amidohydrolase
VPTESTEPNILALVDVRVWDGNANTTSREPQTIRIEGSRIAAIGTESALTRGAQIIEPGPDSVAIPGLIDAHVHMALNPALPDWRAQLAIPRDRLVLEMEARADAMLRGGITTARDLGAGGWLEVALRDRIARGEIQGPRLLCVGQPVTTPRGHCWFWGGTAANSDEIDAVVQRQVAHEVDWIKVMATGGLYTKETRIEQPQFQEAELRAVVESARARGRLVAAHCHGTAGIERAVAAGARTLEHCSFASSLGMGTALDAKLAERIAAQQTWVSPAVSTGWARRAGPGVSDSEFFHAMRELFRMLRSAGVKLIASTDAGMPGVSHTDLPRALALFARFAELTPVEVLRTATSEAARALGIGHETGSLQSHATADILVLDGDPVRDLDALTRPRLVIARGAPVRPSATRRSSGAGSAGARALRAGRL